MVEYKDVEIIRSADIPVEANHQILLGWELVTAFQRLDGTYILIFKKEVRDILGAVVGTPLT